MDANKQAIQDLYNEILAGGPGTYTLYYYVNEGGTMVQRPYVVNVGEEAFNEDGTLKTDIFINYHNPGSGNGQDSAFLSKGLNSTTRVTIDIFNDGSWDPYTHKYVEIPSELVDDFAQVFSVDSSNVGFTGYSASGHKTYEQAIDYINRTGASNITIVSVEPSVYDPVNLTAEEIETLNNAGATIVDIHMQGIGMEMNKNGNNDGLHYYDVDVICYSDPEHTQKVTGHGYVYQIFGGENIGNITSGDFDWESLSGVAETTEGTIYYDYVITEHIPNPDGTYTTRVLTPAEMNEVMANKKIVSDLDYVSQRMSEINKSISSSSIKEKLDVTLPRDSNTTSPQINIDIYNKLCSGIEKLCDNLYRETVAIVKAATLYSELDESLKNTVKYSILSDNVELGKKIAESCPLTLYNTGDVMPAYIEEKLKKAEEETKKKSSGGTTQKSTGGNTGSTYTPSSNGGSSNGENYAPSGGTYTGTQPTSTTIPETSSPVETPPPPEQVGEMPPPEQVGETPPPEQVGETPPPEQVGETPPPEQVGETPPPEQVGEIPPPVEKTTSEEPITPTVTITQVKVTEPEETPVTPEEPVVETQKQQVKSQSLTEKPTPELIPKPEPEEANVVEAITDPGDNDLSVPENGDYNEQLDSMNKWFDDSTTEDLVESDMPELPTTEEEINTVTPTEPTVTTKENSKKGNGIFTAAAITAAVAGTAGAAYYGIKKSKENNELEDEINENPDIKSDEDIKL